MKIIKTYYLIDYENVGSEGFKGCGKLRETDIIHLFYTDNSRKIDLDIINDHGESKLITHKVPTGNQSADMHLGSYLGYLIAKECTGQDEEWVGSANRVMMNRHFTTLFIDEAAQALEAACWIAIGKADRVILAGDHHQLPPTIKCIEAEREGVGRTLMQKIAHTKPETVSLLKIQYRMHEDIMRFSSQWFYHNELESAPEVSGRGILRLDTPIVWFDTSECDFTENTREETMSRVNRQEAELLVEQLRSYIQKISKERVLEENIDFGLISPYKAQVQYIRKLIKQDAFFKPLRRLITVHTVDGFQGQERDVILISLVRANEDGKIGFLNDLRRMNVAITRARMKLMILGDASTLTRHAFYNELYNYISQRGKIITINTKQEHEL